MFISIFQGVTPVIGSIISKEIINELQLLVRDGIGDTNFFSSSVFFLIVFLFVYRFLHQLVSTVSTALNRIAGEKVVSQVKLQIMHKTKDIDLASFDMPEFYEKLENANREAGNRPIAILSQTFTIISKIIELISYIAVLAIAPGLWWAVPVIIAVSVPSAIINFIYRRKNFRYMRRKSKDRRQMTYYSGVSVNKDVVKEVKMFDLGDVFIDEYKNVFDRYYKGLKSLIITENIWHTAVTVVSSLTNLLFYVLIARLVFRGEILIGDYTLYTGAVGSIATAVASLVSTSAVIYEGTLFIDNLMSFMNHESSIEPRIENPIIPARGTSHTIEMVGVSFRYPGTDRDVLKNINLTFHPGETVVLVGLNGAGKTTLIKLLTRLYDPTEGYILLDGRDLRDYDVKELYRLYGIIFQDFGKYAVSVSDNIRFGDIYKKFNADEIKNAAMQSNADDYIKALPDGYDTPLMRVFEPDGIELSGGQWQKLAIARAFYSESDILILDEPTAALDPMAEQEIFNQFDRLRADKTTIFVSHRLSSATVASLIVVLENGEVIEKGTHRELMEKGGRYCELFTTQAKRYLESTNVD
jgi:ABC-type multidrug transport system fused ATPase/permease subunit